MLGDTPLVLHHYDTPVSVRDMLHGVLDRLLDAMIERKETWGGASVTVLEATGATEELFGGRTLMLALDLDPTAECDCGHCDDPE